MTALARGGSQVDFAITLSARGFKVLSKSSQFETLAINRTWGDDSKATNPKRDQPTLATQPGIFAPPAHGLV
jgi:hypothetical protein